MAELTSTDYANLIATAEKEYSKALDDLQAVEETILLLQREIIDKQGRKKDLEYSCSKAKYNVRQIGISLRLLKAEFWSAKESGL